jgi:hypothetical protein
MSQEHNAQSRRARRLARQRNHPTLVTTTGTEIAEQVEPSTDELNTVTATEDLAADTASETTSAPATKNRRGFFSIIGKHDSVEEKDVNVAQARLARATRGKAAKVQDEPDEEKAEQQTEKKTTRAAAAAGRTQTRPNTFKTRYIIGMALYLLCANFIGAFEVQYLRQAGLDKVLTQFNLFGGNVVISTSTLAFLATLILILVLLAKLDFIPSSLISAPKQTTTRTTSSTTQPGTPAPKYTPPPVRQGVQGEDDDLYQAYRSNLRREKKK